MLQRLHNVTNKAGQTVNVLNNTASQFAAHSRTVEAAGLPLAAAFGFMPGLMFGFQIIDEQCRHEYEKELKSKIRKPMAE